MHLGACRDSSLRVSASNKWCHWSAPQMWQPTSSTSSPASLSGRQCPRALPRTSKCQCPAKNKFSSWVDIPNWILKQSLLVPFTYCSGYQRYIIYIYIYTYIIVYYNIIYILSLWVNWASPHLQVCVHQHEAKEQSDGCRIDLPKDVHSWIVFLRPCLVTKLS